LRIVWCPYFNRNRRKRQQQIPSNPADEKKLDSSANICYNILNNIRVYPKTGEMTNSEGFLPCASHFPQEYLLYFKGKWCGTGQKGAAAWTF